MRIKNSPYNLRETFGYFKRNFFGPVSKNRDLVSYAPQSLELNPVIEADIRIGFIGDIMDMAGRDLRIGSGVKDFFKDCNVLVGNFESTITSAKGPIMAQRHKPQILDALEELFEPKRTCLGLANNHSGDFGHDIWSSSRKQLENRGFQVFGTADRPFLDLDGEVRLTACTWWSNQPCDYIVHWDAAAGHAHPEMFNILYPHWGYELELFPRPQTHRAGLEWLQTFDAVIGHHSHTPQPVTVAPVQKGRHPLTTLIAYGLGDFCIWENLEHYLYGQVVKCDVGRSESGGRCIGFAEWHFTSCLKISDTLWETDLTDSFPFLDRSGGAN